MARLIKNELVRRLVKCLSVLLVIMVISGGALAILNDVLYVSPAERTARAVKKIYGTEKEFSTLVDVDRTDEDAINEGFNNQKIEYSFDEQNKGVISKVYLVGDTSSDSYDYLFLSTGDNGYKGGNISLWAQVTYDKTTDKYSLEKIIIGDSTKQTLMSKLGSEYISGFEEVSDIKDFYDNGKWYSANVKVANSNIVLNPISGATKSATAGCNAVNCVIKYVGEVLS